jgi:glycosyltransferase involved in cell wall biosynthesis
LRPGREYDRVTLGIVYHMPFWRDADGTLREVEGSFARYVDSLAPYFDEISLCVPLVDHARGTGTPIRARNVTVAALPPFEGPVHFYPLLPAILPRLVKWARTIDVLHCRVPSPAAIFAFAAARLVRRPAFLLVVGDLQAMLPSVPYRGLKKVLWGGYTAFEEWGIGVMSRRSLTFANGPALTAKHTDARSAVIETKTTTISERDIAQRVDTCAGPAIRALVVSRIDPRKGLHVLPATVRALVDSGLDFTVDVVGPAVGQPGEREKAGIEAESRRLGIERRISFRGSIPLEQLLPAYAGYDLFVLPTLPGEGIPRVLLEAMASGLPIVTTRVAGIPGLVTSEINGLLVEEPTVRSLADAVNRIVADPRLRRSLIANGYATARRHTLETQAARMMEAVSDRLHVKLRPVMVPVG